MRVYRSPQAVQWPRGVRTAVRAVAGVTVACTLLMQGAPGSGSGTPQIARIIEPMTAVDIAEPAVAPQCPQEPSWVATPQALPVDGWFSDGYKWRQHPVTGERRFHRGLDIVAPADSVVRAPADGIVTHAASAGGYGNLIELDHRSGFRTRFAHLAKFLVQEGQTVRFGDDIGLVGSTGLAKGAHLHYEVLKDGRRVNPWPYLGNGHPKTIE